MARPHQQRDDDAENGWRCCNDVRPFCKSNCSGETETRHRRPMPATIVLNFNAKVFNWGYTLSLIKHLQSLPMAPSLPSQRLQQLLLLLLLFRHSHSMCVFFTFRCLSSPASLSSLLVRCHFCSSKLNRRAFEFNARIFLFLLTLLAVK